MSNGRLRLETGYSAPLPPPGMGACPCWGQKDTDTGGGNGAQAEEEGGALRPLLAGPRRAAGGAHGLGHDEPQQQQDPGPQHQAHHVVPGVICRGQERTVTEGGPWEEPPPELPDGPKESHGGNRGPKGTWESQGKQTRGEGDTLGSSWAKEG